MEGSEIGTTAGVGATAGALIALFQLVTVLYNKFSEKKEEEQSDPYTESFTETPAFESLRKSKNRREVFYFEVQEPDLDEFQRIIYRYDSSKNQYQPVNELDGGVFGPNIAKTEIKWTDSSGRIVDLSYSDLFRWNLESYRNFIENPSVQFVRRVASKMGSTFDWKKLFENPNALVTKYFEDSQPKENFTVFNSVNVSEILQKLQRNIETYQGKPREMQNEIQKRKNDIADILEILGQADKVLEGRRFVARELFLTSIFHSPVIVFEPVLQGAVESTLYEIRQWTKLPEDVNDKLLFVDLVNQECSIVFAEAVAELMILANKNAGLSTTKGRLLVHNISWITKLNRLRSVYRYKGTFVEAGIESYHEKLQGIEKEKRASSPTLNPKKTYFYAPTGVVELK